MEVYLVPLFLAWKSFNKETNPETGEVASDVLLDNKSKVVGALKIFFEPSAAQSSFELIDQELIIKTDVIYEYTFSSKECLGEQFE